ncbi:MAG: galactokinase [Lentisphaerae bacterium]|nr:galactokinase [Lentisphaerota bacterium]
MINREVYEQAASKFASWFGRPHTVAAYAPGRVEVLGNHTDYNEGFVLSTAINLGTFFLAAPASTTECRLVAGDLMQEETTDLGSLSPGEEKPWSNYVKGVLAALIEKKKATTGLDALFYGNIPLGAGLSSSAALEISAGLAFCSLLELEVDRLDLAKIGQRAEHEYAGVRSGLLDQISSLFGREQSLVLTDFRSLEARNVPFGSEACFLMCNTGVSHSLVESAYNERREKCEEAADFFGSALDHPVSKLRDVSLEEWEAHSGDMDATAARRAAHVIGENDRVLRGADFLASGEMEAFGELMFESHESSRVNFENSCPELDVVVAAARGLDGVLGARLSGGGFGGSAVLLVRPHAVDTVSQAVSEAYAAETGGSCRARLISPANGAGLISSS